MFLNNFSFKFESFTYFRFEKTAHFIDSKYILNWGQVKDSKLDQVPKITQDLWLGGNLDV